MKNIEIKQLRKLQAGLRQINTLTELHGINARAKIKHELEALLRQVDSWLEHDQA